MTDPLGSIQLAVPTRNYTGVASSITASIESSAYALADPTTVTAYVSQLNWRRKYVYLTDSALTKTNTGLYALSFTPDRPGRYRVQFIAEGTVIAKASINLDVVNQV